MTSAPEAAATDRPGTTVVGIDGSPTSLRAGAYAAGEVRRTGARILVVHVLTIPLHRRTSPGWRRKRAPTRSWSEPRDTPPIV
jgi:nucleotide-binding universal stress UspA family protein